MSLANCLLAILNIKLVYLPIQLFKRAVFILFFNPVLYFFSDRTYYPMQLTCLRRSFLVRKNTWQIALKLCPLLATILIIAHLSHIIWVASTQLLYVLAPPRLSETRILRNMIIVYHVIEVATPGPWLVNLIPRPLGSSSASRALDYGADLQLCLAQSVSNRHRHRCCHK